MTITGNITVGANLAVDYPNSSTNYWTITNGTITVPSGVTTIYYNIDGDKRTQGSMSVTPGQTLTIKSWYEDNDGINEFHWSLNGVSMTGLQDGTQIRYWFT